ncbi:MAG: aminopeptidase [Chloroflexota bacterium]
MIRKTIRSVFQVNLGLKQGERLLVLTDRPSVAEVIHESDLCRRERLRDIAMLTAEVGKAFTKKIVYQEYPALGSHGIEPPENIWRLAFGEKTVEHLRKSGLLEPLLRKQISPDDILRAAEIVRKHAGSAVHAIIALSNYSTSHTRFRDLLTRICGCRYASMPLFDITMLEGSMNVDWRALAKRTNAIAAVVNKADAVEIRTPNGSRLSLSKLGRKALSDTGILTRRGAFGNLPAGEVFLAPVEGSATGKLVLEWAPTRALQSQVTLTVRNGRVEDVAGREPFADLLKTKLGERAENSNIAEFGIGTNTMAKRPDNLLESEKILGTIHIALGDNSSFGGKVQTPFHQDFVFFKPTVRLKTTGGAETVLLKDGILQV